jgi:hypothetical protein
VVTVGSPLAESRGELLISNDLDDLDDDVMMM